MFQMPEIKKSIFSKVLEMTHAKMDEVIAKAKPGLTQEVLDRTSLDYDPWNEIDESGFKRKPTKVSYRTLKLMALRDSIVTAIINNRINQVASFSRPQKDKYDLGFMIELKEKTELDLTPEQQAEMKEIADFLENTGLTENRDEEEKINFDEFLRRIVRDRLTYDSIAIEKIYTPEGKLHHFVPVDGSTIRFASTKDDRNKHLKQYDLRQDEQDGDPDYAFVQVYQDTIQRAFTRKHLAFRMANVSNDIEANGYSVSELELLLGVITTHLNAESYNRKQFTQGSIQKGILHFKANISQRKLNMFKKAWYAQTAGAFNYWRTPIVAGMEEVRWIPMHQNNKDLEFHLWMEYNIKIICAIYLTDPSEINFDISQGGVNSNPMFASKNEYRLKQSKDRGLRPLLRYLEDVINQEIIKLISDKYTFRFVGLDQEDKRAEVERYEIEARSFRSINEIRKENGLKPLNVPFQVDGATHNVYDEILTPQTLQFIQFLVGQSQQQQMMDSSQSVIGQDEMPIDQGQPLGENQPSTDSDNIDNYDGREIDMAGQEAEQAFEKSKGKKIKIEYFTLGKE